MFEGPNKNRDIILALVAAVILVLIFLYATNRFPGVGGTPATVTTPAR